jgi:hypothetical protein
MDVYITAYSPGSGGRATGAVDCACPAKQNAPATRTEIPEKIIEVRTIADYKVHP